MALPKPGAKIVANDAWTNMTSGRAVRLNRGDNIGFESACSAANSIERIHRSSEGRIVMRAQDLVSGD